MHKKEQKMHLQGQTANFKQGINIPKCKEQKVFNPPTPSSISGKKNPYKAAPRTIVQWPLKRDHRVKKIVDINQKVAFNWQLVFYRLFHNPNHTNKSVKLRETGQGGHKIIQQLTKQNASVWKSSPFTDGSPAATFALRLDPGEMYILIDHSQRI